MTESTPLKPAPSAEDRRAAAEALAAQAELATRVGRHGRANEILEAAMWLDPSPERIAQWALSSTRVGSVAQRDAMKEVASWFAQ